MIWYTISGCSFILLQTQYSYTKVKCADLFLMVLIKKIETKTCFIWLNIKQQRFNKNKRGIVER